MLNAHFNSLAVGRYVSTKLHDIMRKSYYRSCSISVNWLPCSVIRQSKKVVSFNKISLSSVAVKYLSCSPANLLPCVSHSARTQYPSQPFLTREAFDYVTARAHCYIASQFTEIKH